MKEKKTMTNYGSLYKVYLERYNKAYKEAKAKNLPIADKYDKDAFKGMFEAVKRTEGFEDLKDTQIVRKLIDRQRYGTTTEAQGRAIYQALRARGIDMDISTIRAYYEYVADGSDFGDLPKHLRSAGEPLNAFFKEIKEFYNMKRLEGFSPEVIQKLVAQVYFGSP